MSFRKMLQIAILGIACGSALAQPAKWPSLPSRGFVTGRPATLADVAAGNAAFAAEVKGKSNGKPIRVAIPQYAYFKDGKQRVPVIVIQAEEAQGRKLVGARTTDGKYVVGLITDFELLGTETPKSVP